MSGEQVENKALQVNRSAVSWSDRGGAANTSSDPIHHLAVTERGNDFSRPYPTRALGYKHQLHLRYSQRLHVLRRSSGLHGSCRAMVVHLDRRPEGWTRGEISRHQDLGLPRMQRHLGRQALSLHVETDRSRSRPAVRSAGARPDVSDLVSGGDDPVAAKPTPTDRGAQSADPRGPRSNRLDVHADVPRDHG